MITAERPSILLECLDIYSGKAKMRAELFG